MRRNQRGLLWLGISMLAALTLPTALLGQASPDSETAAPLITDWSHNHLIFSRPATAEQAAGVERDPRYRQQLRRQSAALLSEVETGAASASTLQPSSNASSPGENQRLGRDWAQDMGSGATVGAGNYPAKFSFNETTASCASDFIVYNTGLKGSGTQPSILAYNNVYTACEGDGLGTAPAVYWAFNTGGKIQTSTEFSRDGSQIAFVQTSGGVASLVLLKWQAGSGLLIAPAAPTSVSSAVYPTCAVPCMIALPLVDSSGAANDTNSSVFYDYGSDTAYVGDDSGFLHKFTPVFVGTSGPKEVTTGGWPKKVNSTTPTALTSPVYDSGSANVFVEDKGGYLYRVNSAGTATQSGLLDHSTALDAGPGMVQGPIVDSSAGLVYVFATSDGSAGCLPAGHDCSAVYLATTSFAANNVPTKKVTVGTSTVHGTKPNPLYIGAFDKAYENSTDPPTGNLYVCGDTGLDPILYRVPIAAGAFGTVTAIVTPTPAGKNPACGPVTDISNPNTSVGTGVSTFERVFYNVQNNGIPTLCGGIGCALSFVDLPWHATTHYDVGQEILVLRGNNAPWIQVAIVAGDSGAIEPGWPGVVGAPTTDGGATWLSQGATTLTPLATWTNANKYKVHDVILDNKGNVEIVLTPGTSGGTAPNWNTTAGGLTLDGTGPLTWTNAGVLPSAALTSTGGTSGFIIDNVVSQTTELGASQVYFSTLANQSCVAGTGGCAVQASQSGLE